MCILALEKKSTYPCQNKVLKFVWIQWLVFCLYSAANYISCADYYCSVLVHCPVHWIGALLWGTTRWFCDVIVPLHIFSPPAVCLILKFSLIFPISVCVHTMTVLVPRRKDEHFSVDRIYCDRSLGCSWGPRNSLFLMHAPFCSPVPCHFIYFLKWC